MGRLSGDGIACVASGLFLFVICSFMSFMRFWSQRIRHKSFRHHDYLVLVSLVSVTAGLAFKVVSFANGEGYHVWEVPPWYQKPLLISFTISSVFWDTASTTTRISILLVYIDIFKITKFRRACYWMIGLTVIFFIINIVMQIFSCPPLWKSLSFLALAGCRTTLATSLVLAIGNSSALDFITAIMPLTVLWRMQMPLRRKVGVMMAFGALLLVCFVDITRLVLVSVYDLTDITLALAPIDVVLNYEVFLGIIAACIPTILPATKVLLYRYRVGRQLFVYGNLWFQRLPHTVWGRRLHDQWSFAAYAYQIQSRGRRFRERRPQARWPTEEQHVPMAVLRVQTTRALEGENTSGHRRHWSDSSLAALLRLPGLPSPRALIRGRRRAGSNGNDSVEKQKKRAFNPMKTLPNLPSHSYPELPPPVGQRRGTDSPSSFLSFFQRTSWVLLTTRLSRSRSRSGGSGENSRDQNGLTRVSEPERWEQSWSPPTETPQPQSPTTSRGTWELASNMAGEGSSSGLLTRAARVWHPPAGSWSLPSIEEEEREGDEEARLGLFHWERAPMGDRDR